MPISATLNTYPILLLPPDLDAGMTSRATTVQTDDFEGDAGDMLAIRSGGLPNTTEEINFLCKTRDELDELESFLRSLCGRWQSFWVPSWNDDITVITPGAGSRTIRDIDYTASMFPNKALGYIHIISETDWADWCLLAVTNAVNNGDGTETLSGTYSVPGIFDGATSATHRFMLLRFVRLASDDVTIEHLDGERSLVTVPIINVPASNPQFNVPVGFGPIELTNTVSPFDPTMLMASLRGTPPGDWFTSAVADPTPPPIPTCGTTPDPSLHCGSVVINGVVTWRTEPIASATMFGPMRFSILAGNGGFGTYDRYSKLHIDFVVRQMRAGVEIQGWNTNSKPTDWTGGGISPSTAAISFAFAAGDWLEIDFNARVGLNGGYTDGGSRPSIIFGNPYRAYLYIYGGVQPQFP